MGTIMVCWKLVTVISTDVIFPLNWTLPIGHGALWGAETDYHTLRLFIQKADGIQSWKLRTLRTASSIRLSYRL